MVLKPKLITNDDLKMKSVSKLLWRGVKRFVRSGRKLFSKRNQGVTLIAGLDGAGKSTLIRKLRISELADQKEEELQADSYTMPVLWTVDMNDTIDVDYCKNYLPWDTLTSVIFIVNSADRTRFTEVKKHLHELCSTMLQPLGNVPILIWANQQDVPQAVIHTDLREILSLDDIKQKWCVAAGSCWSGDGLCEALDWLKHNYVF